MNTYVITLIPHAVVRAWPSSPAPMPPAVHSLGRAYLELDLPLKNALDGMKGETEQAADIKSALDNAIIRLSARLPTDYNFVIGADSFYIPIFDPITHKVVGHLVDTMVTNRGVLVDRDIEYPAASTRQYTCFLCISIVAQLI